MWYWCAPPHNLIEDIRSCYSNKIYTKRRFIHRWWPISIPILCVRALFWIISDSFFFLSAVEMLRALTLMWTHNSNINNLVSNQFLLVVMSVATGRASNSQNMHGNLIKKLNTIHKLLSTTAIISLIYTIQSNYFGNIHLKKF